MALNPDAAYDVLAITREISIVSGGATEGEISLFAYLSCLLSVYKANPPEEWGYRFSATYTAAPYSEDLSDSIQELMISAMLVSTKSGYTTTPRGEDEFFKLSTLERFESRTPYLKGACGSSLVMPLPKVGESISAEPSLRRALELSSKRELLGEAGREALLEHFNAVAQAVPDAGDLMIPAVVWLEYLASTLDNAGRIAPRISAEDRIV